MPEYRKRTDVKGCSVSTALALALTARYSTLHNDEERDAVEF